jgi:hypothetical protein
VIRSGHSGASPFPPCSGPRTSRYGTKITTITRATASALRRTMVPIASASTPADRRRLDMFMWGSPALLCALLASALLLRHMPLMAWP